jgi:hypothetical protein
VKPVRGIEVHPTGDAAAGHEGLLAMGYGLLAVDHQQAAVDGS